MDLQSTAQLLGNIGEFVGSIMVVVTLVYLALQVRQSKGLLEENRRIALIQAYGIRTGYRLNWHENQLESGVAEVLAKIGWRYGRPADDHESPANYEIEVLTPAEQIQLRNLMQMQVIQLDHTLYQASLSLLDDDLIRNVELRIARLYFLWERLNISVPARVRQCYERLT
jgi:hypothetical protein